MKQNTTINAVDCAISNLVILGSALDKYSKDTSVYNSSFGHYLEQAAKEMIRMSIRIEAEKNKFVGVSYDN